MSGAADEIARVPIVASVVQYFHAADRPPLAAIVTAAMGLEVQLIVFWPGADSPQTKRGVKFSAEPQAECWRWPA